MLNKYRYAWVNKIEEIMRDFLIRGTNHVHYVTNMRQACTLSVRKQFNLENIKYCI